MLSLILPGSLWTEEPAWKLRAQISRTADFAADELVVFKDVPMPENYQRVRIHAVSNIWGKRVELADMSRGGKFGNRLED